MAGCGGGRLIQGELEKLRKALRDYYGALNELQAGLQVKVPEKPEALVLWQQCEALGLPLYAGGLMDQPHIWILEIAVLREEQQLFDIANRMAEGQKNG